jgi:hypothetical protein
LLAACEDLAADGPEEALGGGAHGEGHVAEAEEAHRLVAGLHGVVVDLDHVAVGEALEGVERSMTGCGGSSSVASQLLDLVDVGVGGEAALAQTSKTSTLE